MNQTIQLGAKSFRGVPKFGWIWLSLLGHDHESGTIHADPDFQRFLLRNKKKLDNSFFIILGDHGLRGGRVTRTQLGSIEVNNPMFAISIPKKLRRSTTILATLRENANRLQTTFDIRATLLDILKYQPKRNFTDREYMAFEGEYGSSLLRSQGGTERSCKSLLIPLAYCTCQYPLKEVKRTTGTATAAGIFLIEHINELLEENNVTHICETLSFKHTLSISAYVPEDATKTYHVSVKAHPPSNGEFKAIVRQTRGKFEMASSSIDRLDRFGKSGDCVKDSLKHLCYCKVQENSKSTKKP
ncbi:hypothetical protein OESDEN_02123 [Oesophagostomum dentatum]|uniref:Uncharacterized protein n=1 Tax=Oesophagostomum dentatum TaxID=61180 RepID=A0A0B1TPY4_OESDE|nr:hypothetical protein OESDEN_02123 [Oesophagostomum dentatum]